MRVARPVVSFGVGFLRNASLRLQSNVEKNKKCCGRQGWHQDPDPTAAWLPALVTTDPRGGVSGTSPGRAGCSEGMGGGGVEPSPGGLKTTTCVTSSCYFGLYAPKLCEFGFLVN